MFDHSTPRQSTGGTPAPQARFSPRGWLAPLFLAMLATVLPGSVSLAVEYMPVADIQPGMKGVGKSVFRGISIEEFGVEIIGVMERARPAGNLILFRGDGDVLEHAGIIQGMSGSPVYIDGKLIGAVAFAYPGAKDPIGAITPIGEMVALWDGGLGPAAPGPFPSLGDAAGSTNGSPSGAGPGDSAPMSTSANTVSASSSGEVSTPASAATPSTVGQYFDFGRTWRAFVQSDVAPTGAFERLTPLTAAGSGGAGGTGTGADASLGAVARSGLDSGVGTSSAGRRSSGDAVDPDPWNVGVPLDASVGPSLGNATGGLVPIGTPLCFSGWDPSLNDEITQVFARLGMPAVPVTGSVSGVSGGSLSAASGGSAASGSPSRYQGVPRLEPGAAIGLRMIGGDADLVAIGTVTHVDGDRVVAFGHPMIQAGEVGFPMTGAWIHTVLANRNVSMKMGSSTNLLGGIWNDRRPGIAGLHGEVPDQLPVRVDVASPEAGTEHFRYTLARNPLLTPFFLPWTVTNSYLASGWVTGDASIRTEVDVYYNGGETVRRVERIGADAPGTSLGASITLPAVLLSINPWETVRVDSMSVRVDYERGNPQATIVDVRSSHRRAHPGDVVRIDVELQPFRGESEVKSFEVEIPRSWAGRMLRFYVGANAEFASWDEDRVPEKFVPHSLEQMVAMIERMPDDSNLTLRVYDGQDGALLQGVELSGLPPSLAAPSAQSSRPGGIQVTQSSLLEERHMDTRWVLSGGNVVSLQVADR
ncbi:MAG: SpoIVB peptidase S55 domain-containing protein [Candidatus Eisenbacteria bacterium]